MTKAIQILRDEIKATLKKDMENNEDFIQDRITKLVRSKNHNLIEAKINGLQQAIATLNNYEILNR